MTSERTAALATDALGLGRDRLLARLSVLERARRREVALEAMCEERRRGHEEAVRAIDAEIEALEVEIGD